MTTRVLLCLLFMSSLLPALGQQAKPAATPESQGAQSEPPRPVGEQDVVRINTNLVQIDVVVTKDGKQVTDLKSEDFELFEDGRPQKITSFTYISNLAGTTKSTPKPNAQDQKFPAVPSAVRPSDPRRIMAIVVDDLGMSFESIARTKQQLRKFVESQLQPNDLVAIVRTGSTIGTLQQFTTDKRLLTSAIDHLRWNAISRQGVYAFPQSRGPIPTSTPGSIRSDNLLNDVPAIASFSTLQLSLSAFKGILQGLAYLPGRKSMIIVTDSFPIEDQRLKAGQLDTEVPVNLDAELHKLGELATRASVVVYGIDTQSLPTLGYTASDQIAFQPPRTRPDQDPLLQLVRNRSLMLRKNREGAEALVKQTGGFLIKNSNSMELQRIMDDQSGYYLIGYRPTDETFNRTFHHITTRVKRSGLTARTRDGFIGVTEADARQRQTNRNGMSQAVTSPFALNDITVRLTTFFVNDAVAGPTLRSFLYLNVQDLTFVEQPEEWHVAKLNFSAVIFGDNGQVIDLQNRSGTVRLKGDAYKSAQRDGFVYDFDLPIKQTGAIQYRIAVQDAASSRIGSAGQVVEIPVISDGKLALSGIVIRGEKSLQSFVDNSNKPPAEEGINNGPAVRRFQSGSALVFAYAIYNAAINPSSRLPQLITQTRVFRDGKPIFTSDPIGVDIAGQTDLQRIAAGSRLNLGTGMAPGQYALQIVVQDRLAKEKQRRATQWIDFEVVD